MIYINSFSPHKCFIKSELLSPSFYRKPRHREVKHLSHGHTAWTEQEFKCRQPTPESVPNPQATLPLPSEESLGLLQPLANLVRLCASHPQKQKRKFLIT